MLGMHRCNSNTPPEFPDPWGSPHCHDPKPEKPLILQAPNVSNYYINIKMPEIKQYSFLESFGLIFSNGLKNVTTLWALGKLFNRNTTAKSGFFGNYSGGNYWSSLSSSGGNVDTFSLSNTYGTQLSFTNTKASGTTKTTTAATPATKKAAADDDEGKAKKKAATEQAEAPDSKKTQKQQAPASQQPAADDAAAAAKKKAEAEAAAKAKAKAQAAATYPSANEFNNFVNATKNHNGKIVNDEKTTENVEFTGSTDNVKAGDAKGQHATEKAENGYLKYFTITDSSGNIYTLTDPKEEGGKLTYRVEKSSSDLSKDDSGTDKGYEFNSSYVEGTRLEVEIVSGQIVLHNKSGEAIAKKSGNANA